MPGKLQPTLIETKKVSDKKKKTLERKRKLNKHSESDSSDSDDDNYETMSESDSDSSYVPRAKKNNKNKKNKKTKDSSESESIGSYDTDDDNIVIGRSQIQQIVSNIFPSRYMTNKVKQNEKYKNAKSTKKNNKRRASSNGKNKSSITSSEEDDEEEIGSDDSDSVDSDSVDSDDSDDSDEDEDEDEDYLDTKEDKDEMYNILLMGGDMGEDDENEYNEEEDRDECDSDDEKAFMKEKYEQVDLPENLQRKKTKKTHQTNIISNETDLSDIELEYTELLDTKKQLTKHLTKQPNSKVLKKAVHECDRSIKKLVKKTRIRNTKAYHKLINNDKQRTNEVDYFKKKLSNKEQLRIMKDLKEINAYINIDKPYRLALLDSSMPTKFKAIAMQKLNILKSMEPGDSEYYKTKHWVDTFMRIPFGVYRDLTIKMEDGPDKCNEFMNNAMTTLNDCVYGLDEAKIQILQMAGQWISNPTAMGSSIAIHGPMGTGKTSLVKEGISQILGREFVFIPLGGNSDASFLEGHSYTYEGSKHGEIIQKLIDCKSMNPVIYFDELDKISDTPRGEEIIGILTHLTDTSQNSEFHDKYFSECHFDLSKCLFIFSYNNENSVNPILRDRMYKIKTNGYKSKEKVTIARNYLLPKIRLQVNFNETDIVIPDETIEHIVSNMTKEEDGVRNLKRCLEIIYTKLNLFRLVKNGSELLGKDIKLDVSFPFTVTTKDADLLINSKEDKHNESMLAMYV